MGLDSYLTASKRLSPETKKEKKMIEFLESLHLDFTKGLYLAEYQEDLKQIKEHVNSFKLYGQVGEINEIIEDNCWIIKTDAMYWRKSNQIHHWFVDNVQNGIDDCRSYDVSVDALALLYDTINTIGKSKDVAGAMLPTASGFFFGDTEYNERYFRDLQWTKKILKKILKPSTINNWKFSYSSSW